MQPSARSRATWILTFVLCAMGHAQTGSRAFGQSTTQPATAAAEPTLAQIKEGERRGALSGWGQFPLLPSLPIQRVVHFQIDNGLLSCDWPAAIKTVQPGRIRLSDLPGIAKLSFMQNRLGRVFPIFEYYDFTDPGDICKHLQVLSSTAGVQIVQDEEFPDGRLHTVSIIQNTGTGDPNPLTLRVQSNSSAGQVSSLAFTSTSLPQLRMDHPIEYERYLRPLFAAFHQEGEVFGVDDREAWQVVSDVWKPAPQTVARVDAILAKLNSDDYGTREAADKALRQEGEQAALYLQSIDRSHFSPEQKARVTHLLIDFCPLSAQAAHEMGHDLNFLMDCLASDDADLRATTLVHLQKFLNKPVNFDVNLPFPARIEAITNLRNQLIPDPTTRG